MNALSRGDSMGGSGREMSGSTTTTPTVLRFSRIWLLIFGLGGAVLIGGLGLVLPPVGRWAVDTLIPVPGPVEIAMRIPSALLGPICALVGLVAGLWLFEVARKESLLLTIADDYVELSQNGRDQHVPHKRVGAVFREGADLVLTDENRRRIARFGADDLRRREVAAAFQRHGYPWLDQDDPYRADFAKWIAGRPEIGADVDALLRERRLAKDEEKPLVVEDLDNKLASLEVDVRDRKGQQHIRRT